MLPNNVTASSGPLIHSNLSLMTFKPGAQGVGGTGGWNFDSYDSAVTALNITTAGNATFAGAVEATAFTIGGVPIGGGGDFVPLDGTVPMHGTLDFVESPTAPNVDNTITLGIAAYSGPALAFYGYASGQGNVNFYRAGGNAGAPTATFQGEIIGGFAFYGHGATGFAIGGRFDMLATEVWTDTGHGSGLRIYWCPVSSRNTSGCWSIRE